MNVLLLGSDTGAADAAESRLRDAGHRVSRCHDAGEPAFPCKDLDGGCPLDAEQVEVALLVRDADGAEPTPAEDGARCALRRHLPLVVSSASGTSPFDEWAAETVTDEAAAVAALERAHRAPLKRHSEVALEAFVDALGVAGVDADGATAEVTRTGTDLRVELRLPREVETRVAETASVRAVGAVRAIDPFPTTIDVNVEQS